MEKKKKFINQEDDEKVLKIIRRHLFVLFKENAITMLLLMISFIVMAMYFRYNIWVVFVIAFLVFFFCVISIFYHYFTWEKDVYIITDRRIVDVDQKTLFAKTQKEAFLNKIQDVTMEITGVSGSLFKYGNVLIKTASDNSLTLDDVHRPEKVQKIIFDLIKQKENKNNEKTAEDNKLMEKMVEMIKKAVKEE
ncbi:MAG TPA: PH domain-containing protein [Patescibacteria group bacterium]|nr:PH domain-containing protein [Patescibacteria group bacterium]